MGTAAVEGENRARRAVDEALNSPLLEENNIRGARNILVNITSGLKEATMDEIFEITEFIQEEAGHNSNLIWGNCYDERLGDKIAVTIIATGFEHSDRPKSILGAAQKPETPSRLVVGLDEEPAAAPKRPTLDSVTADNDTPTPTTANHVLEFDFDEIRNSVEKIRNADKRHADELTPEAHRRRLEAEQRRREEIRNRPINVTKLSSPQTIIELENQPAYLRQQVRLDDVEDSESEQLSNWTISLDDDEPRISFSGNAYLHQKAD